MKTVFTPENLAYFKENYGKFPTEHFATKFNTSKNYITSMASRLGLSHSRLKYVLGDQKEEIINHYLNDNMDFATLGRLYKVDRQTMENFVRKNNVKLRDPRDSYKKYTLNENFFEIIDTEEKAYALGLMYSDGCVRHNNGVKLTFHTQDVELLYKFQNIIESNHPLTKEDRSNCYNFAITNKKMAKDLIALGCIPNKSLILKFPKEDKVPKHLIKHFIRGVFDGDGHVGFFNSFSKMGWKSKAWRFSIVGTLSIVLGIQKELVDWGLPLNTIWKDKRCNGDISHLRYGSSYARDQGKTNLKLLYSFLYDNSTIWMKRKRDVFEFLINYVSTDVGGPKKDRQYPKRSPLPIPFSFKSPSGEIFQGTNVRQFSLLHDLDPTRMLNVLHGQIKKHRGWSLGPV